MRDGRLRLLFSSRWFVAGVFALAVLVKMTYLGGVVGFDGGPEVNAGDGALYHQLALNMVEGQGFSLKGVPTATKPPGYPFFLASVYWAFGFNHAAVRIVQVVLLALVAVITFQIGRRLFGVPVAALGGLLVAIDPLMAYLSGAFMSEALAIFTVALGTWSLVWLGDRPTLKGAAGVGVLWGLATLVRANIVFVLPWLLLWPLLSKERRQGLKTSGIVVLVALLVLVPWTIRNVVALGSLIPVSTVGGGAFWGANNPWAQGNWIGSSISERPPDHPIVTEVDRENNYYDEAFTWIGEHPWDFVRLLPLKVVRLYDFDSHSIRPEIAGSIRVAGLLSYGVFLPFIAVGFLLGLRNRGASVLYCLIGGITTSALVFYGDPRMRSPIQPYLFLFAAVGLGRVSNWVGGRWQVTRAPFGGSVQLANGEQRD